MMKQFARIMVMLTAVLIAAAGMSGHANAEGTRVDHAPVPVDNAWHDYELAKDVYAWCPLWLESNGRLSLSVQTSFEPATLYYIVFLDENLEQVCAESIHGNGMKDPVVWTADFNLTAGQYYVRVSSWNDAHGAFRVKAYFTPSLAHEQAGTSFDTAVWLDAETVDRMSGNSFELRGFLSSKHSGYGAAAQNMVDFYKMQVETDEFEFMVVPVDTEDRILFTIFDSSYQEVAQTWNRDPLKLDLTEGVYYLRLEPADYLCGDYLLKCSWPGAEAAVTAAPPTTEALSTTPMASAEPTLAEAPLTTALFESSGIIPVEIAAGASSSLAAGLDGEANLRWGSSNPRAVVVSQEGMIIGVSAGAAIVAAIPEDGTQMYAFFVTVQ